MPTPTLAIWIMLTSLAPSPMPRQMRLSRVLTKLTTSAFCSGDTRQQMTDGQRSQRPRKCGATALSSANVSVRPSTTRHFDVNPPSSVILSPSAVSASSTWPVLPPSSSSTCDGLGMSRHATPIEMAVCRLSPVSIQNLMPASSRYAIVSGARSCSLSSTAVHPISVRSRSTVSNSRPISCSRSPMATSASLYALSNCAYSWGDIVRDATMSVRRPWLANRSVLSCRSRSTAASSTRRGIMTMSAPLLISQISPWPWPARTMTDMRLRSELNSSVLSTVQCSLTTSLPFVEPARPASTSCWSSSRMMPPRVRSLSTTPFWRTHSSSAISSGESPSYTMRSTAPNVLRLGTTVLQMAIERSISCSRSTVATERSLADWSE
eukprot:Unigene2020_Nuclearia_a/m.6283 Unigene2020_Nuclearia_a/g.6283  ORF Unigene2020_Nuclearia_a/g.6283 Unigene2020_Nuclearia_a/m.6283 type:complete len:379 (+) Unigene2020_Nuclearia_a:861-1997(+)